MWRTALSVSAAILDGVALLILFLAIYGMGQGVGAAVRTTVRPPAPLDPHGPALIAVAAMVALMVLNLLAIGFGTRLPWGGHRGARGVADTFR